MMDSSAGRTAMVIMLDVGDDVAEDKKTDAGVDVDVGDYRSAVAAL